MSVLVHSRGIPLNDSLRTWVEDRFESAITRLGRHGKKVSVFLCDENGPNRGGEDKSCRVVVHMTGQTTLVVEDRDAHLNALIDRVCDRISCAIDRKAERRREHRG